LERDPIFVAQIFCTIRADLIRDGGEGWFFYVDIYVGGWSAGLVGVGPEFSLAPSPDRAGEK